MKEQEIRRYEPFWNHWQISENGRLGEGSFGAVFRIQREEFGLVQYAALKAISIPTSLGEGKEFEDMGKTRKEIQQYYYEIVQEIYHEIEVMAMLKGKSNIVSYEDYEIRERQDGYGYYIFIRMELATALTTYLKDRTMQTEEILHMGKDLCRALIECQKHNILHRDIKPANIFVSHDGDFKLGDFGVAKIAKEHQVDVSVKGSYSYMAPEIYFGESGDSRVDLYSLALVLYNMSNHRLPFYQTEEKRQMITYAEQQDALQRRMAGEKPPLPEHVPECFGKVIVKALAFAPEQRFQDAKEFYQALCQVEMKMKKEGKMENVALEQTVALRIPKERKKSIYGEDTIVLHSGASGEQIVPSWVMEQITESVKVEKSLQKKLKEKNAMKKIVFAPVLLGMVCIGMVEFFGENVKMIGYSSKEEQSVQISMASGSSLSSGNIREKQTTGGGIIARTCGEETNMPMETGIPTKTVIPENTVSERNKRTDKQVSQTKSKTKSKTESKTKSRTESKIESETKSKKQTVEQKERIVIITEKPVVTYVPTKAEAVYAERISIPQNLQLVQGSSITLPLDISPANAEYSVSSSNGTVASVNGRTIQANMAGSCNIIVKSGSKTCSCTVTVSEK